MLTLINYTKLFTLMKKNLIFGGILFIGLLAFISSCVKDTFSEKDAYAEQQKLAQLKDSLDKSQTVLKDSLSNRNVILRDSLKQVGGVINYSVSAVLASDATWLTSGSSKGTQGLDQVIITTSQYGKTISVTTDISGIASFKDLRIGSVNVNVRKTGYTEVDFIALISRDSASSRNVATIVPIFSLTDNLATISGIATVETDLTNDAPEVAANVQVEATIDPKNSEFSKYIYKPTSEKDYGVIKEIAFHTTISKTTTAADGSFTLKVPSSPDGLPINLFASEFAATQKLLQPTLNNAVVWGVQSVRTLFGPPIDFNYSYVPTAGTAPDQTQGAYVQFSAPTGTPAAQPTSIASATAVLSSSGVISVNILNPGTGYTQPPRVVFSHGSGWNSVNAEGTAVLTNGSVTGVTITNAGTGYLLGDSPAVTFTEAVDVTAAATPIFAYSVIGLTPVLAGTNYTSTAPSVTIVGDGAGTTAHAVMAGNITKANITNPGGGYTATPKVVISDAQGNTDLASTAVLTTAGPLSSITYTKPNAGYPIYDGPPTAAPAVVISAGGGSGATGTCTLLTTGDLVNAGIAITAPGAAYTTATVSITGGGGWTLAKATVFGGAITAITITDGGFGYTTNPTITITGDGTGATATATVRFPISAITLTNAGSGYTGAPTIVVGGIPVTANTSVKFLRMVTGINFTAGTTYEAQPVATITSIDGAGAGATATFDVSWKVGALVVDNQGIGYTYIPNVIIGTPQTGGTTATATATLGNGVLKQVNIEQPGKGYTAAPNAVINLLGVPVNVVKEALLTPTVAAGQVTGITVTNAGIGYPFSASYTVRISTFKSAGAATASPNPKSGQIDYITISNPGAGYAVVPQIEIVNPSGVSDANGFGKGATATAVVTDGRITAITVTNPGSGYYVLPNITVTVPFALVKAVGMCNVDEMGRIYSVSFPSWWFSSYPAYTNGDGYTAPPTVTFFPSVPGKGAGATGVAIINNGQVVDVVMTNQGSGYTGKNNPTSVQNFMVTPSNTAILATASKTYVRDIYFGTGMRMTNENYDWYYSK